MILSVLAALHMMRTMERLYEPAPPSASVQIGPSGKNLQLAKQLQSRVGPLMWNDQARSPVAMMRWLTARKMDVDKAEKMVRTHLDWRKEWNIDADRYKPTDPELVEKFFYKITGTTARDGNPIMLMSFGEWDFRAYLAKGGEHKRFYKHHSMMWEHALVAVEEVERKTKGRRKNEVHYYCICDTDKLQYAQISSPQAFRMVLEIVISFEENYPEVIKYAFVINSDWVFDLLLQLLKPFMGGSIQKLKPLGQNRMKWEKYVRRYIDPKAIPYRYGGYSNKERKKMGLAPVNENGH